MARLAREVERVVDDHAADRSSDQEGVDQPDPVEERIVLRRRIHVDLSAREGRGGSLVAGTARRGEIHRMDAAPGVGRGQDLVRAVA
jgi:hypothetical protein